MAGDEVSTRKRLRVTTGCKTCRARRVKCDESRPSCRNCAKKNRSCHYEDSHRLGGSNSNPVNHATASPLNIEPSPARQLEELDEQIDADHGSTNHCDSDNPPLRQIDTSHRSTAPTGETPSIGNGLNNIHVQSPFYLSPPNSHSLSDFASVFYKDQLNPTYQFSTNHPALSPGPIPRSPYELPTGEQIDLKPSEILIFRNYVDTVSLWIDSFSRDQPFHSIVPVIALRCYSLMYSCLALSAKQLALKAPAHESRERENVAIHYHHKAVQAMGTLLSDPRYAGNDGILASSIILSTYEMLDVAGETFGSHLKGVAFFLQSRGVHGNAGGLKGAAYWTWYRHEIWAALQLRRRMFLGADYWKPEVVDSFEGLSVEDIANRAIFIFGQCVSFCNDGSFTEGLQADERIQARQCRAEELYEALEDWKLKLPLSMAHFSSERSSVVESELAHDFGSIWFIYPQSAIAHQVYHASKILLNLHCPILETQHSLGQPRYLANHCRIERSREEILLISNAGVPDAWSLISTQCLYIAGLVTNGVLERRRTLELIMNCQKSSGRRTKSLADALKGLWA